MLIAIKDRFDRVQTSVVAQINGTFLSLLMMRVRCSFALTWKNTIKHFIIYSKNNESSRKGGNFICKNLNECKPTLMRFRSWYLVINGFGFSCFCFFSRPIQAAKNKETEINEYSEILNQNMSYQTES